jgi:hypothetical protein
MYEPMDDDAIKRLSDWDRTVYENGIGPIRPVFRAKSVDAEVDEPTDDVSVTVSLEMLKSVIDALSVCAEDLETEVAARLATPASPTDLRRYHRDVEPAYNAKRLSAQLQKLFCV